MVDETKNTNDNTPIEAEGEEVLDLSSLSDEEVMQLPLEELVAPRNQSSDVDLEDGDSEETGGAVSDTPTEEEDVGEDSTLAEESTEESNDDSPEETEPDPYSDDQSVQEEKAETEDKDESTDDIDYKAEYERVLSPFKASGRTVKPKSIDEMVRLAQMGFDYGRKVAALKQHQRTIQTLEKNNIALEDISYLVDLRNGNTEAIRKLLKEKSIDPMDFVDEKGSEYKPTDYTVSEQEAALNEVIADISNDEGFSKTSERIRSLDTASRTELQKQPELIRDIHAQVQDGTFKIVMDELEYRRSLGEYQGVPDLIAYNRVGHAMLKAGAFDNSKPKAPSPSEKSTPSAQDSGSRPSKAKKSAKEESLRNRKRAASPTKGTAKNAGKVTLSKEKLAKMSDEEVLALDLASL